MKRLEMIGSCNYPIKFKVSNYSQLFDYNVGLQLCKIEQFMHQSDLRKL